MNWKQGDISKKLLKGIEMMEAVSKESGGHLIGTLVYTYEENGENHTFIQQIDSNQSND